MPVIQTAPEATGGGGGGDATAANQTTQITIANNAASFQATAANQTTQIDQIDNTSAPSVFKDTIIQNSVFRDRNNTNSLFYKTLENTGALVVINANVIQSISFTDVTAAGVSGLLNTFLSVNPCFIVGITSSQGAGTHDLFLLYST